MFGHFEPREAGSALKEQWGTFGRHLFPLVIAFEDEARIGFIPAAVPLLDLLDELPLVRSAFEALAIRGSSTQFSRH